MVEKTFVLYFESTNCLNIVFYLKNHPIAGYEGRPIAQDKWNYHSDKYSTERDIPWLITDMVEHHFLSGNPQFFYPYPSS